MKTLLIISGGEAPGINAALYHYAALAAADGSAVVGAMDSFAGLLDDRIVPLSSEVLAPWIGQGGSYLSSSRTPALKADDAAARLAARLEVHQIDNLVLFGGNGSLRHIPPLLEQWGIPYIGIPTTIDNDVPGTEQTLGFDSACNYAYASVDGLMATARAMTGRIFTLETLGGDSGFIALAVAVGGNAHAVLVPEYTYSLEWLSQRTRAALQRDHHALIVLSEGAAGKDTLTADLSAHTGIRVRDVRLGHAQRGTKPSHIDRVLAAQAAQMAYEALRRGKQRGALLVQDSRMCLHEDGIHSYPKPLPDRQLYNRVNALDE